MKNCLPKNQLALFSGILAAYLFGFTLLAISGPPLQNLIVAGVFLGIVLFAIGILLFIKTGRA